ncbi:MAG: hypothetical protein AAB837_01870 [Patescibacteria group bacterium]
MNNWILKNKIIKLAIIMASSGIVLYFVGFFIVFREMKKIEDFYRNNESESYKEKKFLAIKSITETNKESIQTLQDFFIQKDDEVKFIERIEEIARTSAIKFEIVSIDILANKTDLFKEDVSVKINIEGSWGSIINFMDKLEKTQFGILIQNINIDANTGGNWSGFIEFIVFREK